MRECVQEDKLWRYESRTLALCGTSDIVIAVQLSNALPYDGRTLYPGVQTVPVKFYEDSFSPYDHRGKPINSLVEFEPLKTGAREVSVGRQNACEASDRACLAQFADEREVRE